MSWFGRAALLLLSGMLALPVAAQEGTHPKKPFLWKIEGKELKKPSYLFGTIHLSTPAMKNLHPTAEAAFSSADILYTEVPMDPNSQLEVTPLLMRKDGKTLRESIGEKLSDELDAELKSIQPELDSTPFQPMNTWAIGFVLPMLKSQLEGHEALDAMLWKRAGEAGKTTSAIETLASQMKIFSSFSEEENIAILGETLKQMKEDRDAGKDPMADLVHAYVSGDEKTIHQLIQESENRMTDESLKELGLRLNKMLLTDRDISMTATIDEKLQEAPDQINFFAVGTAHLVGEQNIGTQLAAKGYTITRVED